MNKRQRCALHQLINTHFLFSLVFFSFEEWFIQNTHFLSFNYILGQYKQKKRLSQWNWRFSVSMISRRWDLGISAGDWFVTIFQDHNPDGWNQGFHSDQLGIEIDINKGIFGSLRKLKIWIEWHWVPIIIKTESRIYTGCMLYRLRLFNSFLIY